MFFKYRKSQGLVEFALLLVLVGLASVYVLQSKDKTEQIVQKTSYELRDNFDYSPTKPIPPDPENPLKGPVADFTISDFNTGSFFKTKGNNTATSTSTDADGKIEHMLWSIGNTVVATDSNTMTYTYSIDNRLKLSQSYTVTLFVEDNDGLTDTCSKTFKIFRPGPPDFAINVTGVTDIFIDNSATYTMSVTNWGGSYELSHRKCTSIAWNGSSTGSATFSKKFTSAGNVTVTCTAINDWGQTATDSVTVTVEDFTLYANFSGITQRVKSSLEADTLVYSGTDMSTPADKIDWVKYSVGVYSKVWIGSHPILVSAADNPNYRVNVDGCSDEAGVFWIQLDVGNKATGKTATCSEAFYILSPWRWQDPSKSTGYGRKYMSYDKDITPDNKSSTVPYFQPDKVRKRLMDNIAWTSTLFYDISCDEPSASQSIAWPVNP